MLKSGVELEERVIELGVKSRVVPSVSFLPESVQGLSKTSMKLDWLNLTGRA